MTGFLLFIYLLFVAFILWLWAQIKGCGGFDFGPDDEKKDQMILAIFTVFLMAKTIIKDVTEKIKERFSS